MVMYLLFLKTVTSLFPSYLLLLLLCILLHSGNQSGQDIGGFVACFPIMVRYIVEHGA